MGCAAPDAARKGPGVPGQALLDDEKFVRTIRELDSCFKVFHSVALYSRGEKQRDTYSIDNNKWTKTRYFEKDAVSSAGIFFKFVDSSWMMVELSHGGFWWTYRTAADTKRVTEIQRIHISETLREKVEIAFVIRLFVRQRDRNYEQGSLFSYSEFATTIFKEILKRQIEIESKCDNPPSPVNAQKYRKTRQLT